LLGLPEQHLILIPPTSKPIVALAVEKGGSVQAIGRTKSGRNTNVHAISDEQCRPLVFYLMPGQTADIKGAVMLGASLPQARYRSFQTGPIEKTSPL